ncbi:hypothetical protein JRO89_XSUnG0035700 [Xanthoceras sorbifolium]|uniref:Protein kinase domain-containing protein n=1 Tax=Xanthoceras sorbifolium TaxID=99658 RepID=A0ABQ8H022_9ROSI|nr:hypothetical protein JRO89_XSUnG0035700 [Xanthoceras sorbifolium]
MISCFLSKITLGTSSNYGNNIGFSVTSSSSTAGKSPIMATPAGLKEYSVADLKKATKNFRADTLIGEGGFGMVYKGWVDEETLAPSSKWGIGMPVAIKKLKPEGFQGFDEWQSEVNFLGRHYHPNLIELIGYCWEAIRWSSCYNNPLSWDIRLQIAIGAARALAFLHNLEKEVIHRDLKTSNILLDENYNVKLSDFGLAMRGPFDEEAHVTTRVMGTYGYVAPEYSDVFGFGVVLLELLTGLRSFDANRSHGQQNLVDWLKPKLSVKKKLRTIMDVRLEDQYSARAAFQVAKLALKCLEPNPENQPSMKEVVEVLKEIEAMEEETINSKV